MAAAQITRTAEMTSECGVPTFVVHLTEGGPLLFAALLWPEGGISVIGRDRAGWRAPSLDDLALLDETPAGRRWRERIERGQA